MTSPFLGAPESAWLASNALAFAMPAPTPTVLGHTVVAPRSIVATWFDATPEQRTAILELVDEVKGRLDAELHPDGYDLRVPAAEGDTPADGHLLVHVIPRFHGERGSLATGGAGDPFLHHLIPLFARASEIAIVAAFVLETGLVVLDDHVSGALERGAHVRVLTGNYLAITQVGALRRLLAWSLADNHAGRLDAKIVDMADPGRPGTTFHPKSWRFEAPDLAVAFVGSSNISNAALRSGVEWNLRVDRAHDPRAYQEVERAFERLWTSAQPLNAAWIDDYEKRLRDAPSAVAAAFAEVDAPMPHGIQIEALAALAQSRADGLRRRALVVLATGLGKTWLAAFDAQAYAAERIEGRAPRILFLAHREEILAQAERTFRWLLLRKRPTVGWCAGERDELDADFVFASVQKLSRPEYLSRLAAMRFDYAVVDEVHHATAATYRAILDCLDAGFLLGLTATPERADGADVLGLFDDYVAFRADIGVGIQRKLLVPFAYWGIKDDVDYAQVEWRNQRFDPVALVRAIDTQDRMERMWQAWEAHRGQHTIVFCATIEHAEHARAFLAAKGVKVLAVHTGPGSAARAVALAALERGEIEALCAVDIFNEGVDVPQIDCVVMLRPTESPVVFLQQLGRGLRVAPGKERLTVIDFIGNHRIFLDRMRLLAVLAEPPASVHDLVGGKGGGGLPPECTVEIAVEAKDMLLHLLARSPGGKKAVERVYADIFEARGIPTNPRRAVPHGVPRQDGPYQGDRLVRLRGRERRARQRRSE
ncbi:MAG: DEAD/DEAH box helicase family protein [Minicystis sp.]